VDSNIIENLAAQINSRPEIIINNRQLDEMVAEAASAIQRANVPVNWFDHGGMICEIRDGIPRHFGEGGILELLSKVASWKATRIQKEKEIITNVSPPSNLVKIFREKSDMLPKLKRLTTTPVFNRAGSLIHQAGYHDGLYYTPSKEYVMPPSAPSKNQIENAKALLLEAICDFPFVGDSDKTHFMAMLLLPFVRELIDGPTPLHGIGAPTEGTGKGKLAEVFSRIAIGKNLSTESAGGSDDEWRKKITSQLLTAPDYVCFDNILKPVSSPSLAAVLTTTKWQDRRLGVNETLTLDARPVWLASGNNIHSSKEIARRTIRINLDANMERPFQRTGFKHPALMDWIEQNRISLVHACLTLIQYWMVGGARKGNYTKGSYEDWAGVMGGICDAVGWGDFLGNENQTMTDQNSSDADWRAFVSSWVEKGGFDWKSPKSIHDDCIVGEKHPVTGEVVGTRVELPALAEFKNYREFPANCMGRYLTGRIGTVIDLPECSVKVESQDPGNRGHKVYRLKRTNVTS
jgi:hypothetical protein